jgi:hypothetical protein
MGCGRSGSFDSDCHFRHLLLMNLCLRLITSTAELDQILILLQLHRTEPFETNGLYQGQTRVSYKTPRLGDASRCPRASARQGPVAGGPRRGETIEE